MNPVSCILYPVCWINHPVSCILNLEFFISCFLIIEPCILYPVCLINHPVSCILNQAFFILYLNSWTLYPVCWIKHSVYPVSKHLVSCIFRGVLEFQRKGGTFEARQRPIKNIVVPPPPIPPLNLYICKILFFINIKKPFSHSSPPPYYQHKIFKHGEK